MFAWVIVAHLQNLWAPLGAHKNEFKNLMISLIDSERTESCGLSAKKNSSKFHREVNRYRYI
jgi:hypothetical protein